MDASITASLKFISLRMCIGSSGFLLCFYAPFVFAENCNIYTSDAERLRCMEAFYESANGNASVDKNSSAKSQQELTRRRAGKNGNALSEATPKKKSEDVNVILDNLAGGYMLQDRAASSIEESEATARWQSTRLINACATAYCREKLTPYQEAVDQYRGQTNNPAKAEAEAELRWQFRMRANPP